MIDGVEATDCIAPDAARKQAARYVFCAFVPAPVRPRGDGFNAYHAKPR